MCQFKLNFRSDSIKKIPAHFKAHVYIKHEHNRSLFDTQVIIIRFFNMQTNFNFNFVNT